MPDEPSPAIGIELRGRDGNDLTAAAFAREAVFVLDSARQQVRESQLARWIMASTASVLLSLNRWFISMVHRCSSRFMF